MKSLSYFLQDKMKAFLNLPSCLRQKRRNYSELVLLYPSPLIHHQIVPILVLKLFYPLFSIPPSQLRWSNPGVSNLFYKEPDGKYFRCCGKTEDSMQVDTYIIREKANFHKSFIKGLQNILTIIEYNFFCNTSLLIRRKSF